MIIYTTATVDYSCELSEEDSQKVIDYAKAHDMEIEDAVWELYRHGDLDIYENSWESDFSTDFIGGFDFQDDEENYYNDENEEHDCEDCDCEDCGDCNNN